MYAIIKDRNKQYRVKEDAEILVDYMSEKSEGDDISFDDVLYVHNDDNLDIGQPVVEGAKVEGEVIGHEKGEKIVVLKFKRRNRYRKRIGHRQQYTRIRIDSIETG